MEPSRFDELTKALATSTSRRSALKALAATVGGVLGLGSISTAFANCKPNGIGCNINAQCCSGGCCHGTCTDLNTTQNCGSCGNTCDACSTCQGGTCVSSCASGQVCLSNGTCATPCIRSTQNCPLGCTCSNDASGASYCESNGSDIPCTTDKDCPRGQFCQAFVQESLCGIVC